MPMLGNIARLIEKINYEAEEQRNSKRTKTLSSRMYNRIQKIVERSMQEFLKRKAENNSENEQNGWLW